MEKQSSYLNKITNRAPNSATQINQSFYITTAILLFLMAVMLFLRIFPVYHLVFTNWPGPEGNFVNFAKDDAVYHMRLVHNTLHHYPWRVFFDPYTHYPFGNQIHFGPLFTLIIATSALIVGLGHPSPELINIVGAYVPAIMGALTIFPVYFIGKKLGGRGAGLISALFITFMPGNFLMRSMLGFTDHHVAETLFSTLMMLFLIYAIDGSTVAPTRSKKFYLYTFLAALSFSVYLLIWQGAMLFASILLVYFIIQASLQRISQQALKYLLIAMLSIYGLALVLCLPLAISNPRLQLMYYSWSQILMLAMFMLSTCFIYYVSQSLKGYWKNILMPLIVLITIGFLSLLFYIIAPPLFNVIWSGIKMLFHPGQNMLTVREVMPIFLQGNQINFMNVWRELFVSAPLSLLAIFWTIYRIIKKAVATEILFFIWNIVIFAAMLAQARFSYYYAVNAAILSGLLLNIILTPNLSFFWQHRNKHRFIYGAAISAIILTLIGAATYPILPTLTSKNSTELKNHLLLTEQQFFGLSHDWYQALMWLRFNTPAPEGSFSGDLNYDGYYKIPEILGGDRAARYPYPAGSYAIMTWWDFGHSLTFIAHRIPNANPFQKGVVEANGAAGSAPFFVSRDEEQAKANLDLLGSRYVIVDNQMANDFLGAISTWAQDLNGWVETFPWQNSTADGKVESTVLIADSQKYRDTMLYRLYYQDCKNLQHFRLVYETPNGYTVNVRIFEPASKNMAIGSFHSTDYQAAYNLALQTQQPTPNSSAKTLFYYNGKPPEATVKIFEKVPGAVVTGNAPSGTRVKATLTLYSNSGRLFTYSQEVIAMNNRFTLVLPYATEKMQGPGYNYDVTALGYYQLEIGNEQKKLMVTEWSVMNGGLVPL